MKFKLIFRADGSSSNGLGHIMRCLAISEMLNDLFLLSFAVFEADQKTLALLAEHKLTVLKLNSKEDTKYTDDFDAVVLDGYWYDNSYIEALKQKNKKVIQIDDLAGSEFFSDIIINHAIGSDYSHAKFHNRKLLLVGSDYALLRKEFLEAKQTNKDYSILNSITLSMGGADPQNYTLKLLKAISDQNPDFKINVLIGSAYSHKEELKAFIQANIDVCVELKEALSATELVKLLQDSSLFICACSTVVYEALAIKLPIACFLTAQNQSNLYAGITGTGAVEGLGDLQNFSDKELRSKLISVLSNYGKIVKRVSLQNKLIDGQSGERIRRAILNLWN